MNKDEEVALFLVDDHQIVLDGLQALLSQVPGIVVVGEANSGEELLRSLEFLTVDLVILDVHMPAMDGVEVCRLIRERYPDIQVLALTMYDDLGVLQSMMRAGATGYVLKNTSRQELLEAIRVVTQGKKYISQKAKQRVEETTQNRPASDQPAPPAALTSREREILALIAEGFSNMEIGDQLHISHRTVDTHRTNLMKKIGVRNIAGLIRYAFRHGILK